MVHRKNYHEDKVCVCISYSSGNCTYTRDDCWWKHEKTTNNNEYICTHCDEKFKNRGDFMKHRKSRHVERVIVCNHALNGKCHFSNNDCWFRHENESKNENLSNESDKNIIEKYLT